MKHESVIVGERTGLSERIAEDNRITHRFAYCRVLCMDQGYAILTLRKNTHCDLARTTLRPSPRVDPSATLLHSITIGGIDDDESAHEDLRVCRTDGYGVGFYGRDGE